MIVTVVLPFYSFFPSLSILLRFCSGNPLDVTTFPIFAIKSVSLVFLKRKKKSCTQLNSELIIPGGFILWRCFSPSSTVDFRFFFSREVGKIGIKINCLLNLQIIFTEVDDQTIFLCKNNKTVLPAYILLLRFKSKTTFASTRNLRVGKVWFRYNHQSCKPVFFLLEQQI